MMPLDFHADLRAHGYVRIGSFRRYTKFAPLLTKNKRYLVAYNCGGIWSAYIATLKIAGSTGCVFDYDNSGDGPLFTTDDSLPLQDQLPRRKLSARNSLYCLYALA